jgi:hypothetical protein
LPVDLKRRSQPVCTSRPVPGSRSWTNLTGHAFGHLERRNWKIQLVHAPADEFNQQPENKFSGEINFAPDFQAIQGSVFVELPDTWINLIGIE